MSTTNPRRFPTDEERSRMNEVRAWDLGIESPAVSYLNTTKAADKVRDLARSAIAAYIVRSPAPVEDLDQ